MIYVALALLVVTLVIEIKLLKHYDLDYDVEASLTLWNVIIHLICAGFILGSLFQTPENAYKRCTEVIPDKAEYCVKYLQEK